MSSNTMLRTTAATFALLTAGTAFAADLPRRAAPPVVVEERCKATISTPAFGPTIPAPTNPSCWASPVGDLYLGGALTGYAYNFTNPFNPLSPVYAAPINTGRDEHSRYDISNALMWLQKADGPFQFFALGGLYSIPALGFPVYQAYDQNSLLFGPIPVAYGKYIINDEWSLQGGRMFTNIGSELPFTFQNINISRGLLFNQENIINQGVQINYASGPWSASLAVTDGFYSGELNWVTGLLTYKIDDSNTIGVNGGTSFSKFDSRQRGSQFQFATFNPLQNSSIVSVNYTFASGPWTITPYGQYTVVDQDLSLGIVGGAETFGGAFLVAYRFTDWFALGGRFEYITQSGSPINPTTTSLLYGPGSAAMSYTITPTFTFDRIFVRGEYSHVDLQDIQVGNLLLGTLGTGFGATGNKKTQDRYMVEVGVTF